MLILLCWASMLKNFGMLFCLHLFGSELIQCSISWKPVVFTFSYTSKEHKANPYLALYERLGPLDIKVLIEYETLHTTHVAARKRNTAKGLQALIDGRYIVNNETYIDALVQAASSEQGPSTLELDFDGNFPKELDYLPPRGDEPTTRDGAAYAPNPARKGMFEGYTFIFYEQRQFNNLMAPITQGGGKALCHPVIPEKTEVLEFVQNVRNVAGEKGLGSFDDGGDGKGVVVVRFNPVKGEATDWFRDFNQDVSLQLDHRFIEQNEFLDAILGADASVLRRPLDIVDGSAVGAPSLPVGRFISRYIIPHANDTSASNRKAQNSKSVPQDPPPATAPEQSSSSMAPPDPPLTRARGRRGALKFRGFEDDDDKFSSLLTTSSSASQSLGGPSSSAAAQGEAESQGLFVSQDTQLGADQERLHSPTPPPVTVRPSRKRTAPNEDAFIDSLAPTAAALKRRKIAEESARRQRSTVTPPPPAPPTATIELKKEPQSPQPKSKVKKNGLTKEDDEALETARLKAEEAAKAKREALEIALDGIPISAMNDLAIIETMPVGRTTSGPARTGHADDSDRWDEKWNGRKNFKKFRRRGKEDDGQPRVRKVIVRLEEAKKRDYGIGDEYWLESSGRDKESQRRKKKGKETETQGRDEGSDTYEGPTAEQEEDEHEDVDTELANAAARLPRSKPLSTSSTRNTESIDVLSSSDVEVVTRSTRAHPATQTQTQTQSQQTPASTIQKSSVPAKRPAQSKGKERAPAKKSTGIFGRMTGRGGEDEDDSDDDDDGMAFKFRRKK